MSEHKTPPDPSEPCFGPCCFCSERILEKGVDLCRVTVSTNNGMWQVWFCHSACFRERLTDPPEAPGFFDPAHF